MNESLLLTFLLSQFTFIIILIHFSTFNLSEAYGINEIQRNYSINFDKLVNEYLNWWANLPFEQDPQQVDNPCVIQNTDSIIFLQDPFEMGNIKNICIIPNKSLFFPYYIGWCDSGNQGLYGTN